MSRKHGLIVYGGLMLITLIFTCSLMYNISKPLSDYIRIEIGNRSENIVVKNKVKYVIRKVLVDEPVNMIEIKIEDLIYFQALSRVENRCRNPFLMGEYGERGNFQITRDFWADGCQELGVTWLYDTDVHNDLKCMLVAMAYYQRYGAKTFIERGMCHNSGPRWRDKKELTKDYCDRLVRELSKLGWDGKIEVDSVPFPCSTL